MVPLESAASKAIRKVRIPSGTPLAFFHDRPPFVLRKMPRPASDDPPNALSPVPASRTRRGVEYPTAPTTWVGSDSPTDCQLSPPLVVSQTPPAGAGRERWNQRERS